MSDNKEISFKGAPVSEGIAIGVPYFLTTIEEVIPEFSIASTEIDQEIGRYRKALFSSREDLKRLQNDLTHEGSQDAVGIIDTHIQMLEDPLITVHMEEKIRHMRRNTEAVFRSVISEFESQFSKACDSFFQQRLIDVKDISKRILGHLGNKQKICLAEIPQNSVIFVKELAPSQSAAVPASRVAAFVTELGGGNSHAALIARAKGIPYVAAIDIQHISQINCECVIVDGLTGEVIINPTQQTLERYQKLMEHLRSNLELLEKELPLEAITKDGFPIKLLANIGTLSELKQLHQLKIEGIGLFRTEYILLEDSSFIPSEEEQYEIYKELFQNIGHLPLVVRVFDLGGDKNPGLFQDLMKEPNPVLGCRGIRFLLRYPKVFQTQLRALLRAAKSKDLRLLLPLISDIGELREAKKIIEEVKRELNFTQTIPIGCMIEIPSAVLMTDLLASESDFLSIGTNDLVQYTLGVDRSNPAMNKLYYPAHPSIIRLITRAVTEADRRGTHIGLCGEIASNSLFIPLLLGLKIRELSTAPRYIPYIKKLIRSLTIASCERLANLALQLNTPEEISELLHSFDPEEE